MAKTSSTQNNDRRVATQKSAKKSSGGGDERFDVLILSAQERFVNGKIDAKLVKEKKTSGKGKIGRKGETEKTRRVIGAASLR